MMTHYLETKKQYPDCILFYRLGDFYEMFFEDAKTVSRELELTLCIQQFSRILCTSFPSFRRKHVIFLFYDCFLMISTNITDYFPWKIH